MKKLGVVGGMGPLASIDFLRRLIEKTQASSDKDHIHTLLDNNSSIPDRTQYICSQGVSPLSEMISSAKKLQAIGAEFLVMPCNTAHYFYEDMIPSLDIPFINMIDVTLQSIDTSKGVGLMASLGTYEGRVYERAAEKYGISIVTPSSDIRELIDEIIYGIKGGRSIESYYIKESYSRVLHYFNKLGVEAVILGCTELSLISVPVEYRSFTVDPVEALIDRVISYAREEG